MGIARTIARNAFFNGIAGNSDMVLNLVVSIMLARGLGTVEYGSYSYFIWALALAVVVVNLGLGDMLMRFVPEAMARQQKEEVKSLIRFALLLRVVAALAGAAVVLAASGLLAGILKQDADQSYFVILALAIVPNSMANLFNSLFAGFHKWEHRAYLVFGTSPLRAVLIVALMYLDFGVKAILIANAGIWLLGAIVGFFLANRTIPLKDIMAAPAVSGTLRKQALKYSLSRATIWGIDYIAWGSIAVLLIGLYRPVEQIGFYTIANRLSSVPMQLIPAVLSAVLLPSVSEQFGKGDMLRLRNIYVTSARYVTMLALPVAAAGIALAGPIVKLLYGNDYSAVVLPMQVMFLPAAIFIMAGSASAVILGINRPVFLIKVTAVLSLVNLGLSVWLIQSYGILGAAIAGSVPRIIYLVLCVLHLSREIKTPWPLGDTLRIAVASLIMGLGILGLGQFSGTALSVGLSVPLGLALYVTSLLGLKAIRRHDLALVRQLQVYLPAVLRKNYVALLGLMERRMQTPKR